MDKERMLGTLRANEPELKTAGLIHLRLFGSVARGENPPGSDVDLLVACGNSVPEQLLQAHGSQDTVTETSCAPVHCSSGKNMTTGIWERVLSEAVVVF